MIGQIEPASLSAQQKAAIIYGQARSELTNRLWQAALGADDSDSATGADKPAIPFSLDSLLTLLGDKATQSAPQPQQLQQPVPTAAPALSHQDGALDADAGGGRGGHGGASQQDVSATTGDGYGPNAAYVGMLRSASERTGIPAAALATIVHAEAAKGPGGRWLPYSRNPRSSAAGLGQFLGSTWRHEAERAGSWLNGVAQRQGWLNEHGKVLDSAKSSLLSLRYDAEASIQATADYAKANLESLRRAGVQIAGDSQSIAQAAYLGHHLGLGDAIRFLKGGLDPARARTLLNAQIGSASASRRIAAAGGEVAAHRHWLLDYVDRNIRPSRFESAPVVASAA
ncbi:peptidoglycan-binding protein [Sphingobium sp. H39-3-25]|uniref:peptidoglycan-binding protein n=1 Tax=Sphingobium arseniciresistens TaxID=3030834 RepID=UPI0023B9BFBF|nr:peptidoglycan-binding protein [Sphingobium arseniciresistens]